MESAEFQRILNIGLGRAILHLQKNPASRSLYRDAILYACLNNTAYDPQAEGDRTEYLTEIIQLSDEPEFYRDQILREFARLEPASEWTHDQFFDFALRFAQQGHRHARSAHRLVTLDGFKGFLFALDPLDSQRYPEKYAWEYEYLLEDLEEMVDVDEALATEYSDNPQLRRFVIAIRKSRHYATKEQKSARKKKAQVAGMTYYEIKQNDLLKLSKKMPHFAMGRWSDTASEDDLNAAAEDFLAEENPQYLLPYIDMFQRRQFPLDPTKLFHIAEYGDDRVERKGLLAVRAINALENVAHPGVRELALRMIEQGNKTGRAIGLLQNNFEENDWKRIQKITEKQLEAEDLHNLGFSVGDIFKLHPSEDAVGTLINLYNYGPCSRCRERFVDLLHQLNKIPDWMLEECQFDSNPHLRARARQGFVNVEEKN